MPRNHALLCIQNARKTFTSIKALNIFDIYNVEMLTLPVTQVKDDKDSLIEIESTNRHDYSYSIPGSEKSPQNKQFTPENRPSQKETIVFQPIHFQVFPLAVRFREAYLLASSRYRYLHAASFSELQKYHISAAQLWLQANGNISSEAQEKETQKLEQRICFSSKIQQTCLERE